MQHPELINRVTKFSKIWKLNIMLLVSIMIAGTFAASYADVNSKASSAKTFASGDCGARIAVSLDRSSSIGVSEFGGSQANVDTIKRGVTLLNNSIICLLYTSPSPRDRTRSRMPSSA